MPKAKYDCAEMLLLKEYIRLSGNYTKNRILEERLEASKKKLDFEDLREIEIDVYCPNDKKIKKDIRKWKQEGVLREKLYEHW